MSTTTITSLEMATATTISPRRRNHEAVRGQSRPASPRGKKAVATRMSAERTASSIQSMNAAIAASNARRSAPIAVSAPPPTLVEMPIAVARRASAPASERPEVCSTIEHASSTSTSRSSTSASATSVPIAATRSRPTTRPRPATPSPCARLSSIPARKSGIATSVPTVSMARHGPWNQLSRLIAVVTDAACASPPIAHAASEPMPEPMAWAKAESSARAMLVPIPPSSPPEKMRWLAISSAWPGRG